MGNPMVLSEAKTVDLAIDEKSVAAAEAAAAEAADVLDAIERQHIEADQQPKGTSLLEQRQLLEIARKRAARTRMLADRAKAARRLLDLEQVGNEVAQLAADASKPSTSIEAAIRQIAAGREALMKLCQEHDDKVLALIKRARDLDVEPPAPVGPRASSSHVAIVGNGISGRSGIQSGAAAVRRTDPKTAAAAALQAASGDADGALTQLAAARTVAAPKRAAHYFLAKNGRVVTADDPAMFADQLRKREIRELDDDETEDYLAGRFHGRGAAG